MSEFVSFFLLGLQYCAGSFGIVILAIVAGSIAYWMFRLIYGQSLDSKSDDEAGAPEGNLHLRAIEDEFRREDF
ncbi:hypothetical protein G6M04_14550 [Agrobacterium rhizogenes]|uniref:hypothetical protein n=1 Tax=Rhizobium rhizogenes TaxID=359 RepID=UPI0015728622|nr:hypothetical protein [Rhizobium rhizogenes]NTG48610.1 hypothetical protein [Rhizobium rhizogenes]